MAPYRMEAKSTISDSLPGCDRWLAPNRVTCQKMARIYRAIGECPNVPCNAMHERSAEEHGNSSASVRMHSSWKLSRHTGYTE